MIRRTTCQCCRTRRILFTFRTWRVCVDCIDSLRNRTKKE